LSDKEPDVAFLAQASTGRGVPRAEINMIPLIDVMLVLLVIFMITAPLLTHAVRLELPRASSTPVQQTAHVSIALDALGTPHWDGEALTTEALAIRLHELAAQRPDTEIRLQADRATPYAEIATTMAAASRAGLTRIGFVTLPGENK